MALEDAIFEYTDISAMRAEGVEESDITDELLVERIQEVSREINERTEGQWFVPLTGVAQVDGTGAPMAETPNRVPVLNITQIRLLTGGAPKGSLFSSELESLEGPFIYGTTVPQTPGSTDEVTTLDSSQYRFEVGGRHVERIGLRNIPIGGSLFPRRSLFPPGYQNVELTGTFGWVEGIKSTIPLSTTTTANLNSDATSVTVTEIQHFRKRDVVEIIGTTDSIRVILTDVQSAASPPASSGAGTLVFDKWDSTYRTPISIASGATVRTFGRVPRQIEWACKRLVIRRRYKMASRQFKREQLESRIIRKRTGIYEYQAQENRYDPMGSGDAEVDAVLARFRTPAAATVLG